VFDLPPLSNLLPLLRGSNHTSFLGRSFRFLIIGGNHIQGGRFRFQVRHADLIRV